MSDIVDYKNLGFIYHKTNANFISYFKDGAWDDGVLREEDTITISAFSPALHYGQQAFEGLKAYKSIDGSILLFRPDENAKRFQKSCERLLIPHISKEKFINAILQTVKANQEFIPPHGSGATLYIRPYVIGIGNNLGVRPAREYIFGVLTSPVGSYFKNGLSPVNFMVSSYDRAAPFGTGDIKVGGNYAASLYPNHLAKASGYADCIYLDPLTHTKIDEAGSANFFGITKLNQFVTPKSPSILASITKMSLMQIAKDYLHMEVLEKDVFIDQLDGFTEAGACGTAAVITPIGGIMVKNLFHVFYSESEVGPVTRKLYNILMDIQYGNIKAPEGWILTIE